MSKTNIRFLSQFLESQVGEISFVAALYWKRTRQTDQREKGRGRVVQDETNNKPKGVSRFNLMEVIHCVRVSVCEAY